MNIPTFEGIMTVVVTPFDQNGRIDLDVLGRHLDFLLANGVPWIVPGGTTGEYYAQSLEERKQVSAAVAAASAAEAVASAAEAAASAAVVAAASAADKGGKAAISPKMSSSCRLMPPGSATRR